jgi:peptidoglycan/xylan/chitin deacetylase (PgdA/CDA1 family)
LEKRYVEYELKRSREKLEDVLAEEVDLVSFPFGKYNHMVKELAKSMGYRKAFTICSSSNNDDSDSFVLERKGMYLFDSPLTLKIKLNGGKLFWIEDLKGRIINAFANGTTLVKKPNYDQMNFAELEISDQKRT